MTDLYKGKISTIKQMNKRVTKDLGLDILFNTADDLSESIFGNKKDKSKLAIPSLIRDMPFE